MFRLSKLTDYATVIMTELAKAPQQRQSAVELSARVGLETPTVAKVLKVLSKGELVKSFRGAQGGYALRREPESISMLEIIEAMEGPLSMTECSIEKGICAQEAICNIRSNWQRINDAVGQALAGISLAEMLRPLPAQAMQLRVLPVSSIRANTEV